MPYWGMRGGDLMAYLCGKGFDCYAASVAPTGSAWDRACELYAQIVGTRTDYGAAHSLRFRHERYGPDFSARPLIPAWGEDTRLVLIGHSFGGATVRLLSHLLAYGDEEEKNAGSGDLSPLFAGGSADRIRAVVALAAPMNGTTAYDLFTDPSFDPAGVRTPWWSGILARMLANGTRTEKDDRDARDFADYDMRIDNALAMNRRIGTLPGTYFFSVPCGFTAPRPDGTLPPQILAALPVAFAGRSQLGEGQLLPVEDERLYRLEGVAEVGQPDEGRRYPVVSAAAALDVDAVGEAVVHET